jgi:hypothetical protein
VLVTFYKLYNLHLLSNEYIRPQALENTGSRPLSLSQAGDRLISSWVGDDQRIPAVVCFFFVFGFFSVCVIPVLFSFFITLFVLLYILFEVRGIGHCSCSIDVGGQLLRCQMKQMRSGAHSDQAVA